MAEDCELLHAKNITITPHVAWASVEARTKLMGIILGQIKEYFQI